MAMIYDGWLNIKDWMRERAAVYEKYAKRMPSMDDHIGISMRLENYGFLYTTLYKNGKSAIEWLVERYCVSVDKKSLIKNDANLWAREHGKPRYILDLLLSVINVSKQTVGIVNSLPQLTL